MPSSNLYKDIPSTSPLCCTDISVRCFISECMGSYGLNCTDPCPPGWYGSVCMYKCTCSANDECDPKDGCKKGKTFRRTKHYMCLFNKLISFDFNNILKI